MKVKNKENLNQLAVEVTKAEGGKVKLSIGQVKEVIKILGKKMYRKPIYVALLLKNGAKG